ncbi:MAG: hypothetical protein ABS99_01480 [Acetobacteraceae bacterium SCN 69-10]|nr:MAG: hypothetical protein ABS99_01480 [Acetobacteraceae bacterium SCN 69-10]OJY65833.1 MAG: hypothetical protein BGP12_18535 [Rhodospirillales bacterium 70-18]
MAFVIRNLSVLAYAQGFTLWHYKAGTAGPEVLAAPGFFDDAGDMFAPGDMVMVSGSAGGRVLVVAQAGPHVCLAPLS